MDNLFFLSIAEIGAMLRTGQLSPVGLTQLALERIEAEQPRLHAFVRVTAERALDDARRAEQALLAAEPVGPLHGIPIALKDVFDTAGIATEAGTKVMAGRIPTCDATVAARLREAGAVLLGKLAMAEGAFADHLPERPAPVNPWRHDAWTGVSSSGAGVAVAAGFCFAAIASDTGGSIRFPASACGVTGLKPSWGRVSRHGMVPMAPSLDHVGPMARSAHDCATIFNVIAGADASDPTAALVGVPDRVAPGRLRGLRIGVDPRSAFEDVHPDVVRALEQALSIFAAEGATVIGMSLPDTRHFASGWAITCGVELATVHEPWFRHAPDAYGPALGSLIRLGQSVPATEYARLHEARLAFTGEMDALLQEVDLVALPVMPMPTPPAAALADAAGNPELVASLLRFTVPWNYSGHPSLTLPGGFASDGLPIGFQLVAPRFQEARLLSAGIGFQQATDWHRRRPESCTADRPASPVGCPADAGATC